MKLEQTAMARLRDWVEPAHPVLVGLHEQLRDLYELIREKYQPEIDSIFDDVSRKIGFVVTTTVPITLEVAEKRLAGVRITKGSPLQGTLFEEAMGGVFEELADDPIPIVKAGMYDIYLIWHDALRLKLRLDWVEPAHHPFRRQLDPSRLIPRRKQLEPVWESHEPAHWFDPGIAIAAKEAIVISAIDEVYPELRLVDRIAAFRQADRVIAPPEVREPAHFRVPGELKGPAAADVLAELAEVLRRHGY